MNQPPMPGLPDLPDSDKTVIIPRPGGRRPAASGAGFPPPPTAAWAPPPLAGANALGASVAMPSPATSGVRLGEGLPLVGPSPLVAFAAPLLNTVATIRRTLRHPQPDALREELVRALQEFEQRARQAGCVPEQVLVARYCLCTVLDEAVSLVPWGESAGWAQRSLLLTLHGETFGGEKFFQYLDQALGSPRANLDLLELLYVCLALGFEGRYHVLDNGRTQLTALRDRVISSIRRERGDAERDLSVHWRGEHRPPKPLAKRLPAWLVLAVVALILFITYITYTLLLATQSDPVFVSLAAVKADPGKYQPPVADATPPPPPPPRLVPLLTAEIQSGQVEVVEDALGSHVTIHGDKFFDPGRADIRSDVVPVLQKVAAAIDKVPGAVTVTGHTDNQPIRSLRFPSNFELSLERAKGVAQLIDGALAERGRVRSDGAAESRPLVANDSAEGRAKNRRVEITLRYAP